MDMDCEVEQRGLPGLAVNGLGEGSQLPEAPKLMFRDWQANLNSIFGEGGIARDRKWMTGSAFLQEPSPGGENAHGLCNRREGAGVIPAPLRPEDSQYGRLRPRSRLKMNSRCSALTAVLAGRTGTDIRSKGDCEGAAIAHNRRAPTRGAGKSPFSLDKDY